MEFINPVYLVTKASSLESDENGDPIVQETKRKAFVHKQSTKQTEFYQAQATGFKPEITIVIRSFEYKEEEVIEYNLVRYRVLRTYSPGDGNTEIVLYKGVNNGSAEINN